MIKQLVELIERLNLSHDKHLVGVHFPEVLALLSIIFGGSFLLFAWKHHEYYLGITGLLIGSWIGILLKRNLAPGGDVAPFIYIGMCGVAGAFIAVHFRQVIGMMLGGFTVAVIASVVFPSTVRPGESGLTTVSAAFLMGGGLGAMFPKFFFVLNTSLIGSIFVTYGVSAAFFASLAAATPQAKVVVHLLVFLPLLIFGVLYQMITTQNESLHVVVATPMPMAAQAAQPR